MLHRDDENNAIVEQFFNRTAAPKLVWKVNRVMGAQYAETPVGTYWIHPEGRHYEVKLDHSPVGYANQDQYAEDPSAEAKKMVGAHYAKALRGKTAAVTAGGKYGFTIGRRVYGPWLDKDGRDNAAHVLERRLGRQLRPFSRVKTTTGVSAAPQALGNTF